MQPRPSWRLAVVTILASLMLAGPLGATAQEQAPDTQTRAQMAAIPLITGDLPDGYRFAGEAFLPVDDIGIPNIDSGALSDAGFVGMYTSVYRQPNSGGTITSYVSAWANADAAEAGFALLEDETVTMPGAGLTDTELNAGTGSAELTTGTIESSGGAMALSDATFVVGRFVVGVAIESSVDTAIDAAGVQALVDTLGARTAAVLGGESPDGTDLALPGAVLDLRPLGLEAQAGFLSAGESEALYNVTGSSLGGTKSTWVSAVVVGEGDATPEVVIAASSFDNADNAARVVEQSAELVPLTIDLQQVEFSVGGVDSARGYQYASGASPDGAPDSFRGVVQMGTTMIVVDVQGAASPETAQTAVSDLLAAQVACQEGSCALPEVNLAS